MADPNTIIFETVRPWLQAPGFNAPGRVEALNRACRDFLQVATGQSDAPAVVPVQAPASMTWEQFLAAITNTNAPALTPADYEAAAAKLGHGVTVAHMRASKKVEAPRGAYDDDGRPTNLFERHVFARNTSPKNRFNASHPAISGPAYGPGGYGAFSAQYGKLQQAFALDPNAACEACSWGAFQVLGENWADLGYESPIDMVVQLAKSEAAHLDSYVRFIQHNHLEDELAACKPNNPASCEPFVSRYNGPGFKRFNYHHNFAAALAA